MKKYYSINLIATLYLIIFREYGYSNKYMNTHNTSIQKYYSINQSLIEQVDIIISKNQALKI